MSDRCTNMTTVDSNDDSDLAENLCDAVDDGSVWPNLDAASYTSFYSVNPLLTKVKDT